MTTNDGDSVAVYTTPTCPGCHSLKAWLNAQGVPFVEKDLVHRRHDRSQGEKTGVHVAPITIAEDKVFFRILASQVESVLPLR